MMKEYYKICLRHSGKNDNTFLFWGSNNAGYYRSIEDAGIYEEPSISFEEQLLQGDFLVDKIIVEKLIKKIVLPSYGEKQETYANRNSFFVLPNTGKVRKELGITSLNFKLDGNRNSFQAYFKDEVVEKFKYKYSKTHFNVKGKQEHFDEWWYCNIKVEADNRNKAIYEVFNSGDFGITKHDCSFIEFKNMVTCTRVRKLVLDKWISL